MYTLIHDPMTKNLIGIKRLVDNAIIPIDSHNKDYIEYLKYKNESAN